MVSQELKNQIISRLFEVAKLLNLSFTEPITFKMGYRSPIYFDWRKAFADPTLRELITKAFVELTGLKLGQPEVVIAGVETGGSKHGYSVSLDRKLPFAYVRPGATSKTYGLGKRIEGDDTEGKIIYLFEDLVTTATSVIEDAKVFLEHGKAKKVLLFSIFSYGFKISEDELKASGFELKSILTLTDLLPFLKEKLRSEEYNSLMEWKENPKEWFENHKFLFEFGYLTMLRQSARKAGNIACFGIDPIVEAMPEKFAKEGILGAVNYITEILELIEFRNLSPAAFKLNHGFFRRHMNPYLGQYPGLNAFASIVTRIEHIFKDVPQITDYKTGDIGPSSENYAYEGFECWKSDSVTISGYMGEDSIKPFTNYCNKEMKKGVYILTRTSNPGAAQLQNVVAANSRPFYEIMAENILTWAKKRPGVGAVVGATSLEELGVIAKKFAGKDIPMLIPGVGKQGGSAREVCKILGEVGYEQELARINSSSALTHPWWNKKEPAPSNWKEIVRDNIEMFLNEAELV